MSQELWGCYNSQCLLEDWQVPQKDRKGGGGAVQLLLQTCPNDLVCTFTVNNAVHLEQTGIYIVVATVEPYLRTTLRLCASTLTRCFSGCFCGSLAPYWHSFLVLFTEKITIRTMTVVPYYIKPGSLCFITLTFPPDQCVQRTQSQIIHFFQSFEKKWKRKQKFEQILTLNSDESPNQMKIYILFMKQSFLTL